MQKAHACCRQPRQKTREKETQRKEQEEGKDRSEASPEKKSRDDRRSMLGPIEDRDDVRQGETDREEFPTEKTTLRRNKPEKEKLSRGQSSVPSFVSANSDLMLIRTFDRFACSPHAVCMRGINPSRCMSVQRGT